MARIIEFTDGTKALFFDGKLIDTYTRRRDAVRGAKRRGLPLA